MSDEEMLAFICKEYEKKLHELMPEEEYIAFITATAKKGFRQEIENMADSDFKEFCLDRFDFIVGDMKISVDPEGLLQQAKELEDDE